MTFDVEFTTATGDSDLGSMTIPKGTVAGVYGYRHGGVGEENVVSAGFNWIMGNRRRGRRCDEAVDGGPIAFLWDRDKIRLDVGKGTLDVLVDPDEFESRKAGFEPLPPTYTTGVLAKYTKLVGSAATGAVCS